MKLYITYKTSEKQLYIENILRKHIQLLQRYLQINMCLCKCVYELSDDYTWHSVTYTGAHSDRSGLACLHM